MPTPEQLLAIGPSLTAIAVAVIGLIGQIALRRGDDRRFTSQREDDDKRWREQRDADDARLRAQRQADEARFEAQSAAEANRQAREHAQAVQLRELEAAQGAAAEARARLREDAAVFVTALGEAHAAALNVERRAVKEAEAARFSELPYISEPWSTELQTKLAVATARMRLYGGDVGETARVAQDELRSAVDELFDQFERKWTNPGLHFLKMDALIDAFTVAVLAHDHGGPSLHAN